jgi:FtsH-binding integral membrane protein
VTPTLLGTIGLFVSAVIATIGFTGFALMARFWTSRGGWHVFWFMLVLAWVLDLAAVAHLFHEHPWFTWLRVGSFAFGMPIVLAWRSWIIFDLQLFRRRQARSAYGDPDSRPEDRTLR